VTTGSIQRPCADPDTAFCCTAAGTEAVRDSEGPLRGTGGPADVRHCQGWNRETHLQQPVPTREARAGGAQGFDLKSFFRSKLPGSKLRRSELRGASYPMWRVSADFT
jgi:hypothetical protein